LQKAVPDIHTLHSDGIISDPGKYQIYSRLRNAMAGSLLEEVNRLKAYDIFVDIIKTGSYTFDGS